MILLPFEYAYRAGLTYDGYRSRDNVVVVRDLHDVASSWILSSVDIEAVYTSIFRLINECGDALANDVEQLNNHTASSWYCNVNHTF